MSRLASPDAAVLFRALAERLRRGGDAEGGCGVDLADWARTIGFEGGADEVGARLDEALDAFALAFGFRLVEGRKPRALFVDAGVEAGGPMAVQVRPDQRLVQLLGSPLPRLAASAAAPVLDSASRTWAAVVLSSALARSGLHFVLRGGDDRSARDFALTLAGGLAGGRMPVRLAGAGGLPAILLRAECHAGSRGAVVVVAPSLLVDAPASTLEDPWIGDPEADGGGPDDLPPKADLSSLREACPALRCTYLWSAPARGALPRALDGVVAGCIGPVGYDAGWAERVVGDLCPGLPAAGRRSILSSLADPRAARPMVAAARAAADGGVMGLPAAAILVSRSFGTRPGGVADLSAPGVPFDPRLVVADVDVAALLDRAAHLHANGVRLLLEGPVGGGKTSLAGAIARAMAAAGERVGATRPIFAISPSQVLSRSWGSTERSLARIWDRASREGGIVLVDELDALCGVREPGVTGGNAALVRSLTDAFIRDLDAHRGVPFLGAVNHLGSVDPALIRRCAFVVHVAADLTPERERLAWSSILGVDPPRDWRPVGASVSDFSMAAARCAAMGETGPGSLAAAIVRARTARRGADGRSRPSGSVH